MTIASVGTPTITTGTASPATSAWGTGQTPAAGHLLVAVVTFNASTSAGATSQHSGTTGWTNQIDVGSAATALARVAIWTKIATGSDAAPSFDSTTSGTVQCSCTLYELSGATAFNVVDVSGTDAVSSATVATETVTTSGNVALTGEFGIAGFARERATVASTITASGSYTLDTSNTGVNSIGHSATMSLASPGTGSTSAATVNYSGTSTTARAAAAVIVFSVATAGATIATASQPAGLRVIYLRKGSAAATVITTTAVVPPPPPTTGPAFFPAVQALRARLPLPQFFPRGRAASNAGAPVRNPSAGPVFHQATSPASARFPRSAIAGTVTGSGSGGAVAGAVSGAGRGSGSGSKGAPVRNPSTGPVFTQKPAPVRYILPPWQPRAGRIGSSFGAPVQNPIRGPAFRPAVQAVRARQPLPRRGSCRSIWSYTITIPVPAVGPVFVAAVHPARAVIPQVAPRGRVASGRGAPVRNPSAGPAVYALHRPVRAPVPVPPRGRVSASQLPVAAVVPPPAGPPFRPAVQALRARLPQQPLLRGRVTSSPGAPVANPSAGPVFRPLPYPVRARLPQLAPRAGRVSANPGAPVRNPAAGPVFRPAVQPAQARRPLPQRGRIGSGPGGPVRNPVPVTSGPPVYPQGHIRPQPGARPGGIFASAIAAPGQASAATISYNTGTTASAITATSVGLTIPSGVLAGDLMVLGVTLFTTDATPPSVSITGGAWTLVSVTTGTNPEVPAGAGVFSYDFAYTRVATGADPGASITLSETGSGAGGTWWGVALAAYTGAGAVDVAGGANAQGGGGTTVTCPAETTTVTGDWAVYVGGGAPGGGANWTVPAGTTTRQQVVSAAGIGAVITDSNGSLSSGSSIGGGTFGSSSPGATVWLSAFTLGIEPQVTPAPPVTAASQFATGRIAFSYGAPVANPVQGAPAPALRQPIRARQPLPVRGRIASNPGGPVQNPVPPVFGPVFRQATSPARIRPSLPPRGRIASSPGAPVRNPAAGPVFRQATSPARSRVPQNTARGIYAAVPVTPPQAPPGVITFNTAGHATADTTASVNLTIPAGVLPGDVMVLAVTCFTQDASAPAITLSGGTWNLISVTTGTNPEVSSGSGIFSYQYAYSRVANGGDPGSTLTISETGSPAGTTWWAVAVAAYTGAYTLAPVDVAGSAQAQGAAATVTCPAETTTVNGDWAVYLGGGAPGVGTSFTTPAGSTSRQAIVSDAGVGVVITDSNGSAGSAGSSIGGGTFGSSGGGVVWLTAFTVGLAATPQPVPAQSYAAQYATGRISFSYGAQVRNPPVPGPVFYPLNHPVQAKALPRRRGLCRAIRFVPLTGNPGQGPQFYPAVEPAAAKLPKPFLKGRVTSNPGGPVRTHTSGPVFRQADSPAVARRPLPPRGRTEGSQGAPVRNPHAGPAFHQATQPARIRPALPPRGRTGSNPGGPVRNPLPPVNGPVFFPATSPARIRPSLPPRGRVASSPGAPVRNPVQGAAVPAQHRPIQARIPLPLRGRTSGNRGTLPVAPAPAPVYPLHGPVVARRPLPPKGRVIAGNPGAPVRNPHPGPVFRQAVKPIRAVIPQNAPRGRTGSNPGGPVENIPFATLKFRTGTPFFQWDTETPAFQWEPGTTGFQWATGTPEAG